jgi:poly-beta-1,6-N-acetyl-D-glucosamine synthase
MSAVLLVCYALLLAYSILLAWLAVGYLRSPVVRLKRLDSLPVTVIICARNERYNIGLCLKTLAYQDYPKAMLELILVDDHSSDKTIAAAEEVLSESGITYRILKNSERLGKKLSITRAIALAANPIIVLRDADTYATSKNWLRSISDFYQLTQADLIIAPVTFAGRHGFLHALQAIENRLLTMLTAGSAYFNKAFLCNGANLVFTKSIFGKVGGYKSHLHIESGDDILFMEDVKKQPDARIAFLNSDEAAVETYSQRRVKNLLRQRTRWASKFRFNRNPLNLLLAILTFSANAGFIVSICFLFTGGQARQSALLFLIFKLSIDILLLFLATGFKPGKNLRAYVIPVAFVYPLYAVTVAFLSLFANPGWKK